MPVTPTGQIVGAALTAGRGTGAFNVIGIEHAEAIVAGAQTAGLPVVLQISENCVRDHGSLEPIALAALALARAATVPVAVHLDHATGADLVRQAVGPGRAPVTLYPFGLVSRTGGEHDRVGNAAAAIGPAYRQPQRRRCQPQRPLPGEYVSVELPIVHRRLRRYVDDAAVAARVAHQQPVEVALA